MQHADASLLQTVISRKNVNSKLPSLLYCMQHTTMIQSSLIYSVSVQICVFNMYKTRYQRCSPSLTELTSLVVTQAALKQHNLKYAHRPLLLELNTYICAIIKAIHTKLTIKKGKTTSMNILHIPASYYRCRR